MGVPAAGWVDFVFIYVSPKGLNRPDSSILRRELSALPHGRSSSQHQLEAATHGRHRWMMQVVAAWAISLPSESCTPPFGGGGLAALLVVPNPAVVLGAAAGAEPL